MYSELEVVAQGGSQGNVKQTLDYRICFITPNKLFTPKRWMKCYLLGLFVYMRSNMLIWKETNPLYSHCLIRVPSPEGSSLMVGFIFLDTAPAQRPRPGSGLHAGYNKGHCEGRPPYLYNCPIPWLGEKSRSIRGKSKSQTGTGSPSVPGWISFITSDKGEASNDTLKWNICYSSLYLSLEAYKRPSNSIYFHVLLSICHHHWYWCRHQWYRYGRIWRQNQCVDILSTCTQSLFISWCFYVVDRVLPQPWSP